VPWDPIKCTWVYKETPWWQNNRARLFKGWTMLSTRKIDNQHINDKKTKYTIHWIVIYLVDRVIHSLNNWDQTFKSKVWHIHTMHLTTSTLLALIEPDWTFKSECQKISSKIKSFAATLKNCFSLIFNL